ncbi:hypothetical protein TNCV_1903311 [Trichonephila clavipes]|nr:hypothetical protein TNCV_1903311 [Trichonephila clavipes]
MPLNVLRVYTEYVLVKSVSPKVLWAESRVQGTGEYFPPLQFHGKIVEVELGGVVSSIVPSGNFAELIRTVTCIRTRRTRDYDHELLTTANRVPLYKTTVGDVVTGSIQASY